MLSINDHNTAPYFEPKISQMFSCTSGFMCFGLGATKKDSDSDSDDLIMKKPMKQFENLEFEDDSDSDDSF